MSNAETIAALHAEIERLRVCFFDLNEDRLALLEYIGWLQAQWKELFVCGARLGAEKNRQIAALQRTNRLLRSELRQRMGLPEFPSVFQVESEPDEGDSDDFPIPPISRQDAPGREKIPTRTLGPSEPPFV